MSLENKDQYMGTLRSYREARIEVEDALLSGEVDDSIACWYRDLEDDLIEYESRCGLPLITQRTSWVRTDAERAICVDQLAKSLRRRLDGEETLDVIIERLWADIREYERRRKV